MAGSATNCVFITQVVQGDTPNSSPEAITPRRLARIPFLPLKERFAGRESLFALLTRELGSHGAGPIGPTCAVHADGGVGKTAVAVELGWQLHEAGRFDYVLFLDATSPATLRDSLADLCDPVLHGVPGGRPAETFARRDAVLRWLQGEEIGSRAFLILDSADSPEACEAVRSFLPQAPRCAKLITSRHAVWDDVQQHELQLFTPEEARTFMHVHLGAGASLGEDVASELDAIAVAVDYLPLALEIVCSYLRKTRKRPTEWLAEWQRSPAATIEHHDPSRVRYHRGHGEDSNALAYVWEQSVARLSDNSRTALHLLAWIAPRPAAFPLLTFRTQNDWPAWNFALAELADSSLLTWQASNDHISIHRMLQAVTRHRMDDKERHASLTVLSLMIDGSAPDPNWNEEGWRRWEQLEPHVRVLLDHLDGQAAEGTVARLTNQFGMWLTLRSQYAEAELAYRRSLAIMERAFGAEHPQTAVRLSNLADVCLATGRLTEAEGLLRRAIAIDEKTPTQTAREAAVHLNNLGTLLYTSDRLAEAEPLFRRALQIDEDAGGSDDPAVARDLSNLAGVLKATHRWDEAAAFYRRAIAIAQTSRGKDHPEVAPYLNNLAELLLSSRQFDEAESLLERAIAITEATLGPEHPNVAIALANLAMVAKETGREARAYEFYKRAIAIAEKRFGPEHSRVAVGLRGLADLLFRTNHVPEAEAHFRRALAIAEGCLGAAHRELAGYLNGLAVLLQETGRWTEAESLLRRAVAIDVKSLGSEHPDTAISRFNLASVLMTLHDWPEAEQLLREAWATMSAGPSPGDARLARCANALAVLLRQTNRVSEAEPYARRAVVIAERQFGERDPQIAEYLNNLATVLLETGRLGEAEPIFLRALDLMKEGYGVGHPNVVACMVNFAGVLRADGRLHDAEACYREALSLLARWSPDAGLPVEAFRAALMGYRLTLQAMGLADEAIVDRLKHIVDA